MTCVRCNNTKLVRDYVEHEMRTVACPECATPEAILRAERDAAWGELEAREELCKEFAARVRDAEAARDRAIAQSTEDERQLYAAITKQAAAEAQRDAYKEALQQVVENEGGCDQPCEEDVRTCNQKHPGRPDLMCGVCVAEDALEKDK